MHFDTNYKQKSWLESRKWKTKQNGESCSAVGRDGGWENVDIVRPDAIQPCE